MKVNTMTKFTKFDRNNLSNLRSEMQAVLNKYGIDSNLNISVGNLRFSDAEVEIKVIAKIVGAKTMTDAILEMRAKALGLVLQNSKGDILTGYNTRAKSMPFIYTSAKDGKSYKCSEELAKMRFSA